MRRCGSCRGENPDGARFCNACGTPLSAETSGETRRVVTVLFCDLVGSTELSQTLDAESLRSILARYFEQMRAAVESHGGSVEKFIGDAVMAVFGIPRVHEDDALRAVRAAGEMRDAIVVLNQELERDRGVSLETRIGVNTGQVVSGDIAGGQALVTGTTVNLAARLEGAAGPGEIVIGDETLRLVRDAVAAEQISLQLKGIADPVRAHRLLAITPGVLGHARRFDSPLVDRESELPLLQQTFDRVASARRCQLFTILGPPGIGKSRFVEEFLRWCGGRATSLRGRCLPYGEGITFWPVAQVVEQAVGLRDSDARDVAQRKIAGLLETVEKGSLIAERVGQAIGLSGGAPTAEETLWAIRRFFESLATLRPLVLVFDDIHWGEPTFLELIEHVLERSRDAPILLVCLARPELLEMRTTWAGGKANATTILLDPLDDDETGALVHNLLRSADLPASVRGRIVEMAGGYPLYAEEMVSVLIDDGLLQREGERWVAAADLSTLALPSTISGILAARLDRLEPDERVTLERASVIGRDFSAVEVAALSPDVSREDIGHHLASLVRREMVRPTPSKLPGEEAYEFRHLLIRDAAYEAMTKATRATLHEGYADWLETWARHRLEEYEEVVAYHLERAYRLRADVGPVHARLHDLARRAANRLAAAGRRALARGDMPASANLLGRAAALTPAGEEARAGLLLDLGLALFQTGEIRQVDSVLHEALSTARERGDRSLEARATLLLTDLTISTDPKAISAERLRREVVRCVELFEDLRDDANLAEALETLGTTYWLSGEIGAMLEVAERALPLAMRAKNPNAIQGAAHYIGVALMLGTTPCDDAVSRMAALIQDLTGQFEAAAGVGQANLLAMLGRLDDARRRAELSLSVFEDLGQGRWIAAARSTVGLVRWWGGDAGAAEHEVRAAYQWFAGRGEIEEAGVVASELAEILFDLGRLDEAEALADETARVTAHYDLEPQIGWRSVKGKVLTHRGALDAAEILARDALDLVSRTEFLTLRGRAWMDLAGILARSGRGAEANEAALEAHSAFELKRNRVELRKLEALGDRLGFLAG